MRTVVLCSNYCPVTKQHVLSTASSEQGYEGAHLELYLWSWDTASKTRPICIDKPHHTYLPPWKCFYGFCMMCLITYWFGWWSRVSLQSAMITALAGWQSLWWNTFSALCEPQIRTSQAVIDRDEDFRACHGENCISNEASKINNK